MSLKHCPITCFPHSRSHTCSQARHTDGKPGDAAEAILIGSTPGSLGGRLRLSRNEKVRFLFLRVKEIAIAIKEVNELLCHYVLHLCKLFAFGW